MLSLLVVFVGALVDGNGRCRSCLWERLWVLLSMVTVAVTLVAVSVLGCSRCCDRLWVLSSEAIVGGFCWERSSVSVAFRQKQSLVAFARSGLRCSLWS